MSLNIKNEAVHQAVRELARLTGVSQTRAVEDAVNRRLDELRRHAPEDKAERILAVGREIAGRLGPDSFGDVDDLLYDEHGLPR
ncbi:type II toxin-antitoxin system VapB family antitoxin [Salinibacterium sp. ZJ454]|uniref:type II toxin-antitoxin system VapB family antitoxin n=1 Tax=Salinibacterium sp. ZJ454 TaxID=2708339 RepID=UPI001422848F|nr:type II toxin-antitoxin system VapB family antitoxin [Salinibacterium sp. ZJ454]